jgi:soluble lytic murein transglycosylase-like protein
VALVSRALGLRHGLDAATRVVATVAILALGANRVLSAGAPEAIAPIVIEPAADPSRAVLAAHLSARFRAQRDTIERTVNEAHAAGAALEVDPLLILAVVAVESSFDPNARSGFGARGLMQIVPRFHQDKLAAHGGEAAVLDPQVNVAVGTQILKDYVRSGGSLRAGLQRYSGYGDDPESRYAAKVVNERHRLRRALRSGLEGREPVPAAAPSTRAAAAVGPREARPGTPNA